MITNLCLRFRLSMITAANRKRKTSVALKVYCLFSTFLQGGRYSYVYCSRI